MSPFFLLAPNQQQDRVAGQTVHLHDIQQAHNRSVPFKIDRRLHVRSESPPNRFHSRGKIFRRGRTLQKKIGAVLVGHGT